MTTLKVPPGLVVTVWRTPDEFTMIPVCQILDVLTGIKGISDGPGYVGAPQESPFILFDLPWHKDFAGHGFEDLCEIAARIASHLAAIEGRWPSAEAHVRPLPVVDARFSFIVTPQWTAPGADPAASSREKLLAEITSAHPELADAARAVADEMAACGERGRS